MFVLYYHSIFMYVYVYMNTNQNQNQNLFLYQSTVSYYDDDDG